MSQSHDLLEYLRAGGSLTVLEAINRFGCYALSQRMGGLRRKGYPIKSEFITTATGKKIKRYWMSSELSFYWGKAPAKDLFPETKANEWIERSYQ